MEKYLADTSSNEKDDRPKEKKSMTTYLGKFGFSCDVIAFDKKHLLKIKEMKRKSIINFVARVVENWAF